MDYDLETTIWYTIALVELRQLPYLWTTRQPSGLHTHNPNGWNTIVFSVSILVFFNAFETCLFFFHDYESKLQIILVFFYHHHNSGKLMFVVNIVESHILMLSIMIRSYPGQKCFGAPFEMVYLQYCFYST